MSVAPACQQVWKEPSTSIQTFMAVYQNETDTQKSQGLLFYPKSVDTYQNLLNPFLKPNPLEKIFALTFRPRRWLNVSLHEL